MGSIVRYTAARLALFGAALGLLYLLDFRSWSLFLFAIVISGLASIVVLSRQRDRMSSSLVRRYREVGRRLDEGAAAEDTVDDDRRRPPESGSGSGG